MEPDRALEIEGLAPDSTLLVAGPPMTGKVDLLLHLLGQASSRSILVSTKYGAPEILERFYEATGQPDRDAAVIDCVTEPDVAAELDVAATVRHVGSARRLTRIGVEFTDLINEIIATDDDADVGVAFHTLSTLVMQSEIKQVYQFLQVFFGQIRGAGWFGIATIDTGGTGTTDVSLLQHHFDGLVETRERDDGTREFQVRGLTPQASPWRSF